MNKRMYLLVYAALCLMILLSAFQSVGVQASEPEVTGVQLNKSTLTLVEGGDSVSLSATVSPSNSNQDVRWTSTVPSVASVDQNGKVIPLSAGTSTIIVTSISGGKTDFCTVTVQPLPKKVTGITIATSSLTLSLGAETATITPTIQPSNATNKTINWLSTNPAVAKVDVNGKVTPTSIGTTTIIATTVDGGFTATCQIKVVGVSVTSITLDKNSITLYTDGNTAALKATITPSYATNKNVIWSSSNTSIASVSSKGVITPRGTGTAMITAKTEDGSKKATCTVTVISKANDVFIDYVNDSKVTVSWDGTSGTVKAELKRSSTLFATQSTNSRKATFTGLTKNTQYDLYIDGKYIRSFRTYDLVNRNVNDLVIIKNNSSSVTIKWNGTSGTVPVYLVENNRIIDTVSTSKRSVTFDDLDDNDTYKIYISGKYTGTFVIDELDQIEDFEIDNKTASSISMSWEGTTGTTFVELKKNDRTVYSVSTSSRKATFLGLETDTRYDVYINGIYMDSFRTDEFTFTDIRYHWAKDEMERLASYQIIKGFPDGTFRPEETVTREQFITMLIRAKKYTLQKGTTGFKDVPSSYWSAPYIYTAIKQGIILPSEYGTKFNPTAVATREEMAVMVARAQKLKADSSTLRFTDSLQVKNKGLVGATVKAKIILGYPDQSFRPKGSLTRAEATTVITRIYQP